MTMFADPTASHEVQLNLLNELRHRLPLCFIGEPAIRPVPTHPIRVMNHFMLVMLLRRILLAQKDPSAFPGFIFQRAEVGMYYKYYLVKLCIDVPISHGKESPLARAVDDLIRREFAIMGDPAVTRASMKDEELQAIGQLHSKMLSWSGVQLGMQPGWHLRDLESVILAFYYVRRSERNEHSYQVSRGYCPIQDDGAFYS